VYVNPTALGATYDLTDSAISTVLLDNVLDLANALGTGNDTVKVAGNDWVQTGDGNDTVLISDRAFRFLDGGKGFDTLVFASNYSGSNAVILSDHVSNARGTASVFSAQNTNFGSGSAWTAGTSTTVTADISQVFAPDGSTTADAVTFASSSSSLAREFTNLTIGNTYTFEVYVRRPATNSQLTNADFSSGSTGWTTSGGAVVMNGAMVMDYGTDVAGSKASQSFSTVIGQSYTVTWTSYSTNGGAINLYAAFGNSLGGNTLRNYTYTETNTKATQYVTTFTATATTSWVQFGDYGTLATGNDLILDNVTIAPTSTSFNLSMTVAGGTVASPIWNQYSGAYNYDSVNSLAYNGWSKLTETFTATSTTASVWLGANSESQLSGVAQATGSFYVWGDRLWGYTADDSRVNANGYHKLQSFERLDFSQSAAKQSVTVTWADVDQLAEKNLASDPQAAANTSNLYVELGNNDWLDVASSGLGNVKYGYWADANGITYDRKYSYAGGSDTGGTRGLVCARWRRCARLWCHLHHGRGGHEQRDGGFQ